jgi:large conductance mechanosensitive channel
MGMFAEFKDFAFKGNALDLAVGVILGGAFGKIVDSVINDLINPIIGKIIGSPDFSSFMIPLGDVPEGTATSSYNAVKALVPTIGIGQFFTVFINFLILAFVVFQIVKLANKWKKEAPPAPPSDEVVLLREIRDGLKR